MTKLISVMIGAVLGIGFYEVTSWLLKSDSVPMNVVGGLMVSALFFLLVMSLWEILKCRN